ncbi:MAG: hypothetical protein ACYC52_06105, partial [Coriobacteriia bacterium]
MRKRLVLAVVLACLLGLSALPPAAYADVLADNAECLSCHGMGAPTGMSQVDFTVGQVDRSTACNKCHWISPHPKHFAAAQCTGCHKQWLSPVRTLFYQSVASTPYGYFTTAASADAEAAQLHEIHTKRTWVAEITEYRPACASCHAAASCDACHESSVSHGGHGVGGDSVVGVPTMPVTTKTAPGTPIGVTDRIDRSVSAPNACAAAACHAAPEAHDGADDADTSISFVGDWTVLSDTSLLGGSATYTTATGAYLETTFNGTGFAWIGARQFNGGIADVYVDGFFRASVDTYLTPWGYERTIYWCDGLPAGEHTLRIANTGAKNVASSGTEISIQLLDFRTTGSFSATPACTNCHDTLEQHYGPERHTTTWDVATCIGSGCHTSADLSVEHEAARPGSGCTLCHGNTTDPRYAIAIAANDTSCGACHNVYEAGTHRTAHWPTPMLSDELGPNYGYYTGSLSTAPTNDCLGCHTSNLVDEHMGTTEGPYVTRLPRYDATGNALDCASCHSSAKFEVLNAIATGTSACETCHAVHAPIPETHASDFTPDADASCAECHSSDLAVVHNGDYSVTTPSGTVLTGCAVCHEYYEGERGAQVQYAIDVANDTDCTACHAGYHTGATASHTADDAASVACADCHGTAGQPLNVTDVHANAALGKCAVCHSNPTRIPDISAKTGECASCHATQGTDYHATMATAHTYDTMPVGCVGANCHAARTLPEAHAAYLSRYPTYATTCALCHQNANPLRIDWTTASADCSTCHTVHADVSTVHTATAPERCFTCHKTADAFTLHKDRAEGECAVCHDNPTKGDLAAGKLNTNCDGCHAAEGTDFHAGMTESHIGMGTSGTCIGSGCHPSRDVAADHERYVGVGKQFSQYPDTCSLCHLNTDPTRIDWSTINGGACSQCHGVPHDRMNHTATSTLSAECTACHGSTQVPGIHGADWYVGGTWAKCDTCHNNPTKGDLTWDKTASDCEQCHNKYPAATNHYTALDHTAAEATGCVACHKLELAPEHIKASSNAVDCLGCHTSTLFSAMTKPWNDTCAACHAAKHGEQDAKHVSAAEGCAGAGCHDI